MKCLKQEIDDATKEAAIGTPASLARKKTCNDISGINDISYSNSDDSLSALSIPKGIFNERVVEINDEVAAAEINEVDAEEQAVVEVNEV